MARLIGHITLCALAIALVSTPVAAQDVDVTGEWALNFADPQGGGEVTVVAVLAQEGTTVTGTLEVSAVPEATLSDGMVDGSTLSFGMNVLFEGQWFTLGVGGTVDGSAISGYIELPEGSGSIPFTGMKTEGVR
ncbi:uncharacterized protein METZ01_LOCUS510237 [marine metagenome]|uniref:Uncharacterized protein n=1 Tax=marine metagenome TaxID=408172 RepID=A0A383ELR5_9ZZZZ